MSICQYIRKDNKGGVGEKEGNQTLFEKKQAHQNDGLADQLKNGLSFSASAFSSLVVRIYR